MAFADDVDVALSRDQIAMGETVTVSFSVNSVIRNTRPDFSPLTKDFRIVGSNRNVSINMINGVTNATTLWQIVLEPLTTGELWIPEIHFGQLKSTPRKLMVAEASSSANVQTNQQNEAVFVKAEVSHTSPYVQSQVVYTFKLFYHAQLQNPTIEPPRLKDANIEPIGDDKYYETIIKGEQFYVFEKRFAIFPNKPGKLIIPPSHFRAVQVDNNQNFMNPFTMMNSQPITLSTPSFTLDVQNVPAQFQGKIWLPAKNISLTEDWSANPHRWETGNPITRTITIEAEGLRADQIPELSVGKIPGVNIYADPPHRSNNLHGNVVVGTVQQKITYIPNQPQSFSIPALQLKWWNTDKNINVSENSKAIKVQVRGKGSNAETTPINTTPVTIAGDPPTTSAAAQAPSISTTPQTSIVQQMPPFYSSIWFWMAICMLLVWLITLLLIWKNKKAHTPNLNTPVSKDNLSVVNNMQFSDKAFAKACKQGDIVQAQKLILLWAKSQWQDPPRSLGKLGEVVCDESFKKALKELEQVLYANEPLKWRGHDLLSAYQKANKMKPSRNKSKDAKQSDPLPPLNP